MSEVHRIGIAGLKVVKHPDKIQTTLGSCIGIAMYDRVSKVGGMAHVMLPSSSGCHGDRGKFADTAVDWLLEDAVKAGCDKKRLAAKITGGASMFGPASDNGLGERNVKAVKERLAHHSIRLVAEDVGGQKGRRMMLNPDTGVVEVQIIGSEPRSI
jgi:chemotaxis protein CheD